MPELAEVEASRSYMQKMCVGYRIMELTTKESGGGPRDGLYDNKIIDENIQEQNLIDAMKGKTIKEFKRRGKQIWMELEGSETVVLFHFGMTGSFVLKDGFIPQYKSYTVHYEDWPPKFSKIHMILKNDDNQTHQLAFVDPRRLGKIRLRVDPLNHPPICNLGIDPVLDGLPNEDELLDKFSRFSSPIKALLLDQEKVFCGIGNWLADEILFQAGIHPMIPSNAISLHGLKQMINAMNHIFKIAVEVNAQKELLPKEWLFHYRWMEKGQRHSSLPDGRKIIFDDCGGRTSAIVPDVQKYNDVKIVSPEKKIRSSPPKKKNEEPFGAKKKKISTKKSMKIIESDAIVNNFDEFKCSDETAETTTSVGSKVSKKAKRSTSLSTPLTTSDQYKILSTPSSVSSMTTASAMTDAVSTIQSTEPLDEEKPSKRRKTMKKERLDFGNELSAATGARKSIRLASIANF